MTLSSVQRDKLGSGENFAVKVENRTEGGATGWMWASPDQVERIMVILAENDPDYLLTQQDVGKPTIRAFGRTWKTEDFIGNVQPGDVGKRVTLVKTADGTPDFLRVESNEQRDRRLNR